MKNFERIGYIYLFLGVFAAIISFISVFLLILWNGEFDILWPLRILYLYAWGLLILFDVWSFIKFPSPFNYIAVIIESLSLIEYSTTFKMIASFGLIVSVIALLFYMRHALKSDY